MRPVRPAVMQQLALNLPSPSKSGVDPRPDAELRRAFARCTGLARRMTFEAAVQQQVLRRCLQIIAEINQKRGEPC